VTAPAYFTVTADYRAVVADLTTDLNADPEIQPLSAIVTFKPLIRDGDAIIAADASPRPTGFVPAPIAGKINTSGRLCLRDVPDGTRQNVANQAALPGTGDPTKYYVALDTNTHYRWTGSAYVEIPPYQPVRLLANSPLLDLDALWYQVTFSQVVYNGRAGKLKGFTFEAPSYDTEVSLIGVMPPPNQTGGVGINAPMLLSAYFNNDDELVFVNADGTLLAPIGDIPSAYSIFVDNGDSTWTFGS
jgi:hypothetical protein